MGKSKVEKTLRDSLSTINDLRRELKKVRKAGEHAVAQQFEKATSSSASEIKKLRDELDRVRETTTKQIADLTAVVARLAPDLIKPAASGGAAPTPPPAPGAEAPAEPASDRPHGDPLREAAAESTPDPVKKAAAKKAPAKKTAAKKSPAKKAPVTPAEAATDETLSLAGEALAASEGVSPIDEDAPGTASTADVSRPGNLTTPSGPADAAPTSDEDSVSPVTGEPASTPATQTAKTRARSTGGSAAKNAAEATTKSKPPVGAKKTAAKKTTPKSATAKKAAAKKTPAKVAGAKSTTQRGGSGGQRTTARKAQKAAPARTRSTPTTPTPTPDNPASADRPASD